MSNELKSEIIYIEEKKKYGYIKGINSKKNYGFNTQVTKFIGTEFKKLSAGDSVYFTLNDGDFVSSIRLCDEVSDLLPSNNDLSSHDDEFKYLTPENNIRDSELIIGIVSPVGVNPTQITETLENRLRNFEYHVEVIRVSELLPKVSVNKENERIEFLIQEGDKLRERFGNDILAKGVVGLIRKCREKNSNKKNCVYY